MTAKEKLLFIGSFIVFMNWGARLTYIALSAW